MIYYTFSFLLNEFPQKFLSYEFKKLNLTHENVINKLENIILPKIKQSADFSALKFSTIFTKDNFNILLDKIKFHYNKIDFMFQNIIQN